MSSSSAGRWSSGAAHTPGGCAGPPAPPRQAQHWSRHQSPCRTGAFCPVGRQISQSALSLSPGQCAHPGILQLHGRGPSYTALHCAHWARTPHLLCRGRVAGYCGRCATPELLPSFRPFTKAAGVAGTGRAAADCLVEMVAAAAEAAELVALAAVARLWERPRRPHAVPTKPRNCRRRGRIEEHAWRVAAKYRERGCWSSALNIGARSSLRRRPASLPRNMVLSWTGGLA